MPWSSFFECWLLSQVFHSPLSLSSRGFLNGTHVLLAFHLFYTAFLFPIRGKGGRGKRLYGRSCVCVLSHVWLYVTPCIVAHQVPLSMEFSRQEYWSGLSFPSPRDLLDPGIEPRSPTLQADSLPSEPPGKLLSRIGHCNYIVLLFVV